MEIFGKRLRARARELSLTDSEVARRAGLTERRYAHYVKGTREPDMATLVRVCRVLNTTPNDLLGVTTGRASTGERGKSMDRIQAAIAVLGSSELALAHDLLVSLVRHKRRGRSV